MDRPSIDDLLKHAGGIYDLATIATKRAIEIKKKEKGATQPLQKALEEISRGEVNIFWKNRPESGEQFELPLEVSIVPVVDAEPLVGEETEVEDESALEESEEEEETEAEEETEVVEAEVVEEEEEYREGDEDIYKDKDFTEEKDEDA